MYVYESSATVATDRLHYKLQTRPLVREGAPRIAAKKLACKRKENKKSGHGPQTGLKSIWIGRLTVGRNINSTQLVSEGVDCIHQRQDWVLWRRVIGTW
jgi:hypothetical protein